MKEVKYPLFKDSLRKLIAKQRKSGSEFSRDLNIHWCTVAAWLSGSRLPKKFLKEILREAFPGQIVFDDEL